VIRTIAIIADVLLLWWLVGQIAALFVAFNGRRDSEEGK